MSITIKLDIKKPIERVIQTFSHFNIYHLLLIVLALHLFVMSIPSDGFIFDEAHYIPASIDTMHGIAANAEHPPLSKILYGTSIAVFGDWWFGWRIFPVIFSTLIVFVIYLISTKFMNEKYSLIVAVLASFDIFLFVNTGIALLDPPALFFGLLGVYFWIDKKYYYGAASIAIAFLCRELALLYLPMVLIYEASIRINRHNFTLKIKKPTIKLFGLAIAVFMVVGLGGLWMYDVAYHPSVSTTAQVGVTATVINDQDGNPITTSYATSTTTSAGNLITNPVQHLIFALQYFEGLTPKATLNESVNNYRPPYSWTYPVVNALNPPAYYAVASQVNGVTTNTLVDYVSQMNYPVTIMLIPTMIMAIYLVYSNKDELFGKLYIGWVAVNYTPWLLFGAFVQKMTFNYYFLYTEPILTIGSIWMWSKIPVSKNVRNAAIFLQVAFTIIWFIHYFPINIFRA